MRRKHWVLALAVVAAGVTLSAASSGGTSERFSFATYRTQMNGITMVVDAYPASLHATDAFIPVPIAVGMTAPGMPIKIGTESFTLVDDRGTRYPVAGYHEILDLYPKRTFDESLMHQRPLNVGNEFDTSQLLMSNFFPAPGRGTRTGAVELHPFTWFRDLLYFPRPQDGLNGVLTLQLSTGGTVTPIEVRFSVPNS